MKKDLSDEKAMHSLSDVVAKSNSRHSSGTGFDMSITGVSKEKIDKLANQCGLTRLKPPIPKGEKSHFMLK